MERAAVHKDNSAVKLCYIPGNGDTVEYFNVALVASASSVATMTATTAAAPQQVLENKQQQKEHHIKKEHLRQPNAARNGPCLTYQRNPEPRQTDSAFSSAQIGVSFNPMDAQLCNVRCLKYSIWGHSCKD